MSDAMDPREPEAGAVEPVTAPNVAPDAAAPVPAEANDAPAVAAEPAVVSPAPAPAPAPQPPAPVPAPRPRAAWSPEPAEVAVDVPRRALAGRTRRDFLLFGAGMAAAALGVWGLLPQATRMRWLPGAGHDALDTLAARLGFDAKGRRKTLDRAVTFDDDVAEALYSKDRRVRTYDRSQVTPLRNNYDGGTPGPEILNGWTLRLTGLASGRAERLSLAELTSRFALHEQGTRLVCVEGWSAVAWWGGIRFADLLAAFPPANGARYAAMRSDVNIDRRGNSDPYYVSIDLPTAQHPMTLLVTQQDGRPLSLAHGAPMRLIVPMKLGLKNIKAITHIDYTVAPPADYWAERGYSKYDGL